MSNKICERRLEMSTDSSSEEENEEEEEEEEEAISRFRSRRKTVRSPKTLTIGPSLIYSPFLAIRFNCPYELFMFARRLPLSAFRETCIDLYNRILLPYYHYR